ncbi:MAG: hypothetical protein AMXMBFR26_08880 [Porticoccaceae bacterium]
MQIHQRLVGSTGVEGDAMLVGEGVVDGDDGLRSDLHDGYPVGGGQTIMGVFAAACRALRWRNRPRKDRGYTIRDPVLPQ